MYGAYGSTIFGPRSCSACATGYDGQGRDEIAAIQTALGTLGYLDASAVTGQYGSQTYTAVQQFQTAYGLDVDGRVGPSTLGLLMEQAERRAQAQAALTAVPAPSEPIAPALPLPSPGAGAPPQKLTDNPMFYPLLIGSVVILGGALFWRMRK